MQMKKNLDLIITDHHIGKEDNFPKALAVVNPNRFDETHLAQPLKKPGRSRNCFVSYDFC